MATSDNANRPADDNEQRETNNRCPECGGCTRSDPSEVVCESCGLVLEEQRIDNGPEWRTFGDTETSPERTGAPLTPARHDRGLSTELWGYSDANGDPVSVRKRRQLGRLKREHTRAKWRSKAERNLAHGISETRRIVSSLDLPQSIRDQACTLFRRASKEDLLPGRSIEAITAGSVYAACRCNGLPRMMEEVAAVAAVDVDGIDTGYTVLNRELGLPAQPRRPRDFVPRFASALDLPDRIRRRALEFANAGEQAGITTGVRPSGFAAACIYLAGQKEGYPLTQARVADVAETSATTIRTHRDKLVEAVDDR